MYSDIYEMVVEGSNTVILAIHEKDYYLSYGDLTRENAQDLVMNYFKYTGRDGIPNVSDIDFNSNTGRIKITVDVEHNREHKLEPMSTPDIINYRK